MSDLLTEKLDSFLSMGVPFYDCIVMKNGVCVYRKSGGYTDPEKTKPVRGTELCNLYSCSKLITCTAALTLYEKGAFVLDDPLSLYMPEFAEMKVRTAEGLVPAERPITIRHLFTMMAGFTYDLSLPELVQCRKETNGVCPTREVMRYLAAAPLQSQPGAVWRYSVCHDVLAALVEVLTGENFETYIQKNICETVGMKNTTFLFPEERLNELCCQYRYCDGKVVPIGKENDYRLGKAYASGGAGVVSTLEDYIAFLEALRTGKLLREETVDLLATNQLTVEQMSHPEYAVRGKRGFGLGQACPSVLNQRPDFGWGGAAGAYYFIDHSRNMSAFLLAHVLGFEAYQVERTTIVPLIQDVFD